MHGGRDIKRGSASGRSGNFQVFRLLSSADVRHIGNAVYPGLTSRIATLFKSFSSPMIGYMRECDAFHPRIANFLVSVLASSRVPSILTYSSNDGDAFESCLILAASESAYYLARRVGARC